MRSYLQRFVGFLVCYSVNCWFINDAMHKMKVQEIFMKWIRFVSTW